MSRQIPNCKQTNKLVSEKNPTVETFYAGRFGLWGCHSQSCQAPLKNHLNLLKRMFLWSFIRWPHFTGKPGSFLLPMCFEIPKWRCPVWADKQEDKLLLTSFNLLLENQPWGAQEIQAGAHLRAVMLLGETPPPLWLFGKCLPRSLLCQADLSPVRNMVIVPFIFHLSHTSPP